MEEQALVVDVADGVAWVEKTRQTQCGGCSLRGGCGSAVLSKVLGARRNRIKVVDPLSVKVGDVVTIQLDAAALIRGSFAVYMIPLFGLFIGAFLGSMLGKSLFDPMFSHYAEGFSVALAMFGMFAGIWWLKQSSKRRGNDKRYDPVIASVVDAEPVTVAVCHN